MLPDTADTVTATIDFDSTVTTGNGTYKVNGSTYKGSNLQVKTADNASTFYNGTASLFSGDAIIDSNKGYNVENNGGDGITVIATNGTISTLGNLNNGDIFTIDNVTYKVLDNNTFVQLDADGNPSRLYENLMSSGSMKYEDIINGTFVNFVELKDGVLDLTTLLGENNWSAIVLKPDTNGDPTIRVAKVSYTDEGGYKLETTSNGDILQLDSVQLGSAVNNFSTTLDIIVNTTANGAYTINGKNFDAQNTLEITTTNGDAVLTNGSVNVAEGEAYAVTARRINSGTQTDEKIQATSGSVTVTVDKSAGSVTIGGLAPLSGKMFKVEDTEYTVTRIGLQNGNSINTSVADTLSVTTANLSGADWQTILQAPDGVLTLTNNTAQNVLLVDTATATKAIKYGTLTKSVDTYILTQTDNDSKLESIDINGTKATFGTKAADINITANNNATFIVTASENFTVDALTTNPIVTNATAVSLSAGTMQATIGIPITANGKTITSTNGDMTVSVEDNKVIVGALNRDDEFTVDGVNYKMTTAGLLDITSASSSIYRIVTAGV